MFVEIHNGPVIHSGKEILPSSAVVGMGEWLPPYWPGFFLEVLMDLLCPLDNTMQQYVHFADWELWLKENEEDEWTVCFVSGSLKELVGSFFEWAFVPNTDAALDKLPLGRVQWRDAGPPWS